MEALEKDFEDFIDSESEEQEEEILEEDDTIDDDDGEGDVLVVSGWGLEPDIIDAIFEDMTDEELEEAAESDEFELDEVKIIKTLSAKARYGASKAKKMAKAALKWGKTSAGKRSRKKAAKAAEKRKKSGKLAKTKRVLVRHFDPSDFEDVTSDDLTDGLDLELLQDIGEVFVDHLVELDEDLTDDELDELLEMEQLDELPVKKVMSMLKRLGSAGAAKASKAASKYYKKNKAKIQKSASKRKGKKPKYRIQRASFDPYLDADGTEVQLSGYDATEDVSALVGDTELSEEFKTKATTIFEAAVARQVTVHVDHLKDTYQSQLQEAVEDTADELVVKIDSYLDYVASNWLEQNQMVVDSGASGEINESFIKEMKKVFDSHYIDVPDTKIDVVNDLSDRLGELESKLDDEITANVSLKKQITEHKKSDAIQSLSGGLTDTDLEKLRELSQSVEYDGDEEEFSSKLQIIKEQYFPATTGKVQRVVEEEGTESFEKTSPVMDMYTSALSRTVKTQ